MYIQKQGLRKQRLILNNFKSSKYIAKRGKPHYNVASPNNLIDLQW